MLCQWRAYPYGKQQLHGGEGCAGQHASTARVVTMLCVTVECHGRIPSRTLSSPFFSTKYAEESGWTSLARSETTPRYSKRSPMVLISANESSSENTLVYVLRNPAERGVSGGGGERESIQ